MSSGPPQSVDTELDSRFDGLLRRMGIETLYGDVYPDLIEHYAEPGRHYHVLAHIRQCLGVVDDVRDLLEDPDAVRLALWFHDIVYEPGSDDNELRSALLFDRRVGVHLPTARADSIHAMIMATVHPSDTVCHDEQYVADVDLSGLGLPWPKFLSDSKALRMESRHLTDSEYRIGTTGFFRKLLSRPSIYHTDYFKKHYGEQAERNIHDFIKHLESEAESRG